MHKFYFCGSIRGGRGLAASYEQIIAMLQRHGQVLTEHLGNDREIQTKDRVLTDKQIHDRDLQWIIDSDMVIAEVTVPSLGVGYEIGRALHFGKPVLCLYHTGATHPLSAMIAGCDRLELFYYTRIEELEERVAAFISVFSSD
jgi:nucleoside 2-deoxyribosyltransferase